MAVRRAPLFSVSLLFGIGCLIGLDHLLSGRVALILWALAGVSWLVLARRETASLVAFFVFTALSGVVHTQLLVSLVPADDLRRLPQAKTFSTTQWRGRVIEDPNLNAGNSRNRRSLDRSSFTLQVEGWRPTGGQFFGSAIESPWQPAEGNVRCTVQGPASEIRAGDQIECAAALEEIPGPLNPGELDFRDMEAKQGVYYQALVAPTDWKRTEAGGGDFWQTLSLKARDWADARLRLGLEDDPRTADFLAGMLIGYRQDIPLDIEQDFRRTGTLHVFAVSGQNIAEMVVVLVILLQLIGLVRWRWAWTLVPLILLYCLLTGSPASAVRATIMAVVILLAWRLGRPLNTLACWSIAFLAMLVWNPAMLLDPGAQLSFAVVLGLVLIAGPLWHGLRRAFQPDPFLPRDLLTLAQKREEKFWSVATMLFAAAVAAELVCDPITMVDFHQVTPISILANLIVVPTAGLITTIGTLGIALSLVSSSLAALLNNSNWLVAKLLIWFVGVLAHQPGASLNVADLRVIGEPTPTFIIAPVQDTACLLVRTSTQTWLINAGREKPARTLTTRLLQYYGVNGLDGLVMAQLGTADNSGADVVALGFHPARLVLPPLSTRSPVEKLVTTLPAITGGKLEPWSQGTTLDLGSGVNLTVLRPASDSPERHAEDRALVLLFQVNGQSLLWAGKITTAAQNDLRASYPDLRADVLVLGVDSAPQGEWLRALQVRDWLQIPTRDRHLNSTASPPEVPDFCRVWPLDQTGAVEVHFESGRVLLRPWVQGPAAVTAE